MYLTPNDIGIVDDNDGDSATDIRNSSYPISSNDAKLHHRNRGNVSFEQDLYATNRHRLKKEGQESALPTDPNDTSASEPGKIHIW